jgi:glycosyltransferase involved in cell wall biosynthesis
MEVARLAPELHFRIVANPSDRSAWDQLTRAAPPNVTLIERFPFAQADQVYGQALILLNTSAFEGFPNAFLQAGKHGVPVVSSVVDPDGFLQRTGSGIVAGPEPTAAAAAIRRLANDPQEWRRVSSNIRAHVERHHDSKRCAAAFARSLGELASVPQDWNRRSARA